MCVCTHTHTHTYIHIYTHTYTYTHTHLTGCGKLAVRGDRGARGGTQPRAAPVHTRTAQRASHVPRSVPRRRRFGRQLRGLPRAHACVTFVCYSRVCECVIQLATTFWTFVCYSHVVNVSYVPSTQTVIRGLQVDACMMSFTYVNTYIHTCIHTYIHT